jgi:hypothetical protein
MLGGAAMFTSQATTVISTRSWFWRVFAIELVSVTITSVRFWLTLHAIGLGGSFAQGATLAAIAIVSTAAGIFPGGLGLRELLSSLIGPAVGLSAAGATVVTAVERVLGLLMLGLVTAVIVVTDRHRHELPVEIPDPHIGDADLV